MSKCTKIERHFSLNNRDIKQVDKLELASHGQPYDLSNFDYKFSRMLKNTNDKVLQQWLSKICDILIAVRALCVINKNCAMRRIEVFIFYLY